MTIAQQILLSLKKPAVKLTEPKKVPNEERMLTLKVLSSAIVSDFERTHEDKSKENLRSRKISEEEEAFMESLEITKTK